VEYRKKLSKYIIGNTLYLSLAFFIGAVFYAFIFDCISSFVFNSKPYFINMISILGLSLVFFGTLITLYKRFRISTNFSEFIYLVLIFFLASYLLKFLSVIDNNFSYPIMFLAVLFSSYLLMVMIYLWKRKSGVSVLTSFGLGVSISSLLYSFYDYDLMHIIIVRSALIATFIFVVFYILGFFGIIKSRRFFIFSTSLIVLILSFYPLKVKDTFNELSKYQWSNFFVDDSKTKFLSTEKTSSGKFDYLYYKDFYSEHYVLAYNSSILPFTYPLGFEQKKFLLLNILQSINFERVLVLGQAPIDFFKFLKEKLKINSSNITYKPLNMHYLNSNIKMFSFDINEYATVEKPNYENNYDLVLVFPMLDNINGAYNIYYSYIDKLKDLSNINLLIFNHENSAINIVNKLKHYFTTVSIISDSNLDLSFYILTNNRSSVTLNVDELKKRFLKFANDKEYLIYKSSLENNSLKLSHKSMKDIASYATFSFEVLLTIILSALLLFVFVIFATVKKRKKLDNIWTYFYFVFIPMLYFYVLSSMYNNNFYFFKYYPLSFSLFILGIIIGLFINLKYNLFKNYKLLFLVPILSLAVLSSYYDILVLYISLSFLSGFIIFLIDRESFVVNYLIEFLSVIIGLGLIISLLIYTFINFYLFSVLMIVLFILYIAHLFSIREYKE